MSQSVVGAVREHVCVYLLSIIENEEIISMISNYFCQMLDTGRQQLPILKIEKKTRTTKMNK